SVGPRRQPKIRFPYPSENTSTRTPQIRAATKWPHSWTNTMTPKPTTAASIPTHVFDIALILPFLDFFPRYSARFLIRFEHIIHRLKRHAWHSLQHAFNHFRYARESQPPFQKRRHAFFIGGIQRARQRASALHCFPRQPQARKLPDGHRLKIEFLQALPVERYSIRCHTLRIGQRILDRHAHIRGA